MDTLVDGEEGMGWGYCGGVDLWWQDRMRETEKGRKRQRGEGR